MPFLENDLLPEEAREAILEYDQGEFRIRKSGAYVCCATTGRKIFLNQLFYWCTEKQEAYADVQAVSLRFNGKSSS